MCGQPKPDIALVHDEDDADITVELCGECVAILSGQV
jgi:hypothetical protein